MNEIDTLAAQLYHAAAPCHPTWDQLSDVTRSVWRERAQAELEEYA